MIGHRRITWFTVDNDAPFHGNDYKTSLILGARIGDTLWWTHCALR